ncbi:hypothetical protein VNI00_000691 [Paramarasmius palmivorus]|uniref:DUF6533 domain-containing protein n=1 Tax=Paramarasmius palmivorus TaxID=297713 RepID=A0AAW0EBA8_9AGAR
MDNSAAEQAAQLIQLHTYATIVNYCCVAGYTWFALDYGESITAVMTLPDEIRFVWSKPWGYAKILFLTMRYFGVILLTVNVVVLMTPNHSVSQRYFFPASCENYFIWEGSAGSIMLYIVELILQLRIYAMYNKNKILTIFNAIIYVIEIVVMLAVYNIGIKQGTTFATPPGLTGCYGITTKYLFSIWIPGLAFEFWLVVLAMGKAISRARRGTTLNGKKVDLLSILVRDSIVYFILVAAGLLVNTILWLAGPDGLAPAAVSLSHAAMFVGGSRLSLNVREAFYREESMRTQTQTSLAFGNGDELHDIRKKKKNGWHTDTQILTTTLMDDDESAGTNDQSFALSEMRRRIR